MARNSATCAVQFGGPATVKCGPKQICLEELSASLTEQSDGLVPLIILIVMLRSLTLGKFYERGPVITSGPGFTRKTPGREVYNAKGATVFFPFT